MFRLQDSDHFRHFVTPTVLFNTKFPETKDPLILVQTGCSARLGALHISQMQIGVTPLAVVSPLLQYSHPDDTGNPGIAMQGLRAITPHAKSLNQHQPWRSEYRQFSTRHKHKLPDQIQGSRGETKQTINARGTGGSSVPVKQASSLGPATPYSH